jgi:Polyketide cyclase / dehydrase and lipid transport
MMELERVSTSHPRAESAIAPWQTRRVTELKMSGSISVAMTPDELYALVSDVTRMGEWSPVCRGCWWDEGDGPRVGAWFTGRNELPERTWETRCQVVAAKPGREFAWMVNKGWVHWGYTFEPEGDGTRLTESWEFLPAGIAGFRERFGAEAAAQIAIRRAAAEAGIPATLAAIKKTAEAA